MGAKSLRVVEQKDEGWIALLIRTRSQSQKRCLRSMKCSIPYEIVSTLVELFNQLSYLKQRDGMR